MFSGTESVAKEFVRRGHEKFSVELDPKFKPDMVADVTCLTAAVLLERFPDPDVIWASPPCNAFSVASIPRHWKKDGNFYYPQTDEAVQGMLNVTRTLKLIGRLRPQFWFMENPRGMLRKMQFMRPYQRRTIAYCQYGDFRQKPTDIWGNRLSEMKFKPMCNAGDDCHEAAPRGSKGGTQGMSGAKARAVIPPEFGADLCRQVEALADGKRIVNQSTLEVFG